MKTKNLLEKMCKGPGKRGHIVADTLLPTQIFPHLPARTTFVADTNFVSGTQKMSLILFRNSLCPQQMFPSLRSPKNIMSNDVSSFAKALTKLWPGYPAHTSTGARGDFVDFFDLRN